MLVYVGPDVIPAVITYRGGLIDSRRLPSSQQQSEDRSRRNALPFEITAIFRQWICAYGRYTTSGRTGWRRLYQFAQIGFSASGQYGLADYVAQSQYRSKIGSLGRKRLKKFNIDAAPARKPLVATKD